MGCRESGGVHACIDGQTRFGVRLVQTCPLLSLQNPGRASLGSVGACEVTRENEVRQKTHSPPIH